MKDNYIEIVKAESLLEEEYEFRKWLTKIPSIKLPTHLSFVPSPNFSGSVARFRVQADFKKNDLSVYLDCYDNLGCFGEPYWELYPYKEDVFRCAMNDTTSLVNAIVEAAKDLENE